MAEDRPSHIYKIAPLALYEQSLAAGQFLGAPIDLKDGYIHFSTARQLAETLRLHFAGEADLVVFAVPVAPLGAALRFEPSRGGDLFPHLYGPLDMALVGQTVRLSVPLTGEVTLPEWVR